MLSVKVDTGPPRLIVTGVGSPGPVRLGPITSEMQMPQLLLPLESRDWGKQMTPATALIAVNRGLARAEGLPFG